MGERARTSHKKTEIFFFSTYGMWLLIRRGIFTRSRCRANYFVYSIPVEMRGKKLFSKFDFQITLWWMIITQFNQYIRIQHWISLRNHMYFVEIEKKIILDGWASAHEPQKNRNFFFFNIWHVTAHSTRNFHAVTMPCELFRLLYSSRNERQKTIFEIWFSNNSLMNDHHAI